jgi:adenylate cyclase
MIGAADILVGRILIVDDQPANVLLLERTLRGAGYTCVASTTDSRTVRELNRANRYDLILLDLRMPGIDGFELMRELTEDEAVGYLPVLVLTAQPDEKLRALKAGARDFLAKPFDLAEVLLRVRNMMEVRLLHLEAKRLYERVLAEKRVSERLLLHVLPYALARRMKGCPQVTPATFTAAVAESFDEATVADIVDFTRFAEGVSPEVVAGVLEDIFARFDAIAGKRGLEKVRAIGAAYLAGQP